MRPGSLAALCACVLVAAGCGEGGSRGVADCGGQPRAHFVRYRVVAGVGGSVTTERLNATAQDLCRRLTGADARDLHVTAQPPDGIVISSDKPLSSTAFVRETPLLQFYDWEPTLRTRHGPLPTLYAAARFAATQRDKPEPRDVPPGGRGDERYWDRRNDAVGTRYFLFGPRHQLLPPKGAKGANPAMKFYASCGEIAADYGAPARTDGSASCRATLAALGRRGTGPPRGSTVIRVPEGVAILEEEAPLRGRPAGLPFYVLEDDAELSGSDIRNPQPSTDPNTDAPNLTFEFTDFGRRAFARVTKRVAHRGANLIVSPGTPRMSTFQHFAVTLDDQIVSLAFVSYVDNPNGVDGSNGAQIDNLGSFRDADGLARQLREGAQLLQLRLVSVSP